MRYLNQLTLVICLLGSVSLLQAQTSEPKSTHTWLDNEHDLIYAYDVDIRVTDFPAQASKSWLYYFAIQVNFTDHDEWSHGGIQWAGAQEFTNSGNKGVNWGGGSDWAGYGGIGRTNTPFVWKTNTWYRYRVWRLDVKDGFYNWGFYVLNYETGAELFAGTVRTKSKYIQQGLVWMETGYGVSCDTERARIEWRNPLYRTAQADGTFPPTAGTASYNGTCNGNASTQQQLISSAPLIWFQETNATRTVAAGAKIF